MADISKINAIALANIAKLDAVDAANIAKVNGLVFTQAAAFLLDTYTGAAAGYSVRRLATSATNLMRIREDAGDTETDIGYDSNNELDTAAIASHCGTANGYVVTWYDQSGNSVNATQGTESAQPQIYNGSAVITENGNSAVSINETYWETTSAVFALADDCELFTVFSGSSDSGNAALWVGNPTLYNSGYFGLTHPSNTSTVVDGGWSNVAYRKNTTSISPVNRKSLYDNWVTGGQVLIGASAENLTDSNQASTLRLMAYQTNTITGNLSEYIVFNSDQSSNRTGIESNVNSNYLIYQPTDTPTSGLLATYSGAAAAYSVRQLANTAVMSMRVRRDSDDEEQNFGFDSNGDLDTAGIAAFCGSANGYVSRWWDQSTNGNHADQATDTSQPQIYNGSAVITENGKPALIGVSTATQLTLSSAISFTDFALIHVYKEITNNKMTWCGAGNQEYYYHNGLNHRINGIVQFLHGLQTNAQTLDFANRSSGSVEVHLNGSSVATATYANSYSFQHLFNRATSGFGYEAPIQEFVLYTSDQSLNRTGIETDINDYFDIYT